MDQDRCWIIARFVLLSLNLVAPGTPFQGSSGWDGILTPQAWEDSPWDQVGVISRVRWIMANAKRKARLQFCKSNSSRFFRRRGRAGRSGSLSAAISAVRRRRRSGRRAGSRSRATCRRHRRAEYYRQKPALWWTDRRESTRDLWEHVFCEFTRFHVKYILHYIRQT